MSECRQPSVCSGMEVRFHLAPTELSAGRPLSAVPSATAGHSAQLVDSPGWAALAARLQDPVLNVEEQRSDAALGVPAWARASPRVHDWRMRSCSRTPRPGCLTCPRGGQRRTHTPASGRGGHRARDERRCQPATRDLTRVYITERCCL
ncbi:hypothetical protein SY2F82_73380 [Streptomyces sp. Y2F8-2]|nr:hypothetical protein SY2F82_73380 [Streptomyces sp. Y2F8-2]